MRTTTTMFAATTPENTPLAYRASTSTNPNPVISSAFVEANYETLESLLRDRRRQMHNNNLRTELEYFSEDYDEEREIKPRPEPARAVTPPLRATSPRVRKKRERVVGFEETQNRGESRVKRSSKGGRPLEEASRGNGSQNALRNNVKGNLPPNGFPPHTLTGNPPIVGSLANLPQGGHIPSTFTNSNILPQNGFTHPMNIPPNSYPFYTQPMYTFPNMPAYANPNSTGLFPNPLGSVTSFVHWIEDYLLPDGLKMPFHIGSYDGKGDPDNFLHLFEGAIRMQKWLMLVACHMFTYTLKDSPRIWWNSQKAGSILDYEDLKEKFRSHFSQQKKFTKTHLILGLHEDQRISDFIHGLRRRSLVKHFSTDLSLTYKGLMKKTYTWVEAKEVAISGVSSDRRDSFERP
ncbi:hypothetical protein Tco_1472935, partial [Tanacetum coccineum]